MQRKGAFLTFLTKSGSSRSGASPTGLSMERSEFMSSAAPSLFSVYEGWDGHQLALMRAITGLTPEHLAYRPAPHLRSVGEITGHLALGRLSWFYRMGAPGSVELARQFGSWDRVRVNTEQVAELHRWMEATSQKEDEIATNRAELLRWLEATWQMIATTLNTWTVADLAQTYRHAYQGKLYAVSRQWTLFRILSHDLHHGGELAILLGMQGIELPDLGDQGGHLTALPLADPSSQT
jgi:uncharacterized damage-inducible protein DinB